MVNARTEIFIGAWTGGYQSPQYQAFATVEEAAAKITEAWMPDYSEEMDEIQILRIDLATLRIEPLDLSEREIVAMGTTILKGTDETE